MTDISHTERQASARDARTGVLLGLTAFSLWGFYALYFKQLAHLNPVEIVAHRAFWSVPFAGVILFAMGRTRDIARAFRSPRILGLLCITTLLVSINWGFFVWAISVDRTLEASLGYYINPLLNVLIGFALLGERFSLAQRVAISLAVLAVIIMTFSVGVFPWLPLLLGGSFATYGYIRKTMDVGPVQGFFVESVLLSVFAVGVLFWLTGTGETLRFATSLKDSLLLISCGPMTAMPLMLFAAAARRLRLSTLGLLQYIAPTGLFLTGVFVFAEPVGWGRLVTFLLIWSALAIYSFEALRLDRRGGR